ncbi:MAG: glycosyltransferase family 39 protein, partial [Verrucomicrobia bacterium]|nr:glycosyltransferase family 39 protein [Verrucomicrobiota bacterium]
GHAGYGTTKDACLWVVNTDAALLGPHFQPAYPLLISVATRLGNNSWSLYVVPLFALFTGLVLMALASRLLAHRLAGLIAFGCYLLNPLTLWHARCARPEIIAGFMVFAGLALLLLAWQARSWTQWWDILLGALCIGAAPFFHITAWYLVIPAAMSVGLVILWGRMDFLLYPLVALGMLLLFYGETRYVTDYYHAQRFFEATFIYWPFLALGLAVLAGTSLAMSHTRLRVSTELAKVRSAMPRQERGGTAAAGNEHRGVNKHHCVSGWLAAGLALVCALFLVNVYFNRESIGSLPILRSMVPNYNILTDWQTFANMVSWPMALLILVGWATWLTGEGLWRPERIGLALTVFPALVLAGTMRDFMMTRYLLMAVIPMSALCLTALATRLPEWPGRPWTAWLAPGLAAVICLMGLTHRGHLVSLVEHRGFLRFLAPFARTIQQDHGILLGEYSRITAPLEHMFGVTALGLDNERKDDYSASERAWETIMRSSPDQPAFFMTPFQMPRSDRFDFTLVKQAVFKDRKLQQAYNTLPTRIREGPLSLSLYQMTLKDGARPATLLTNVMALPMESGNMGLRRFANVRIEKPGMEGITLAAGEQVSLTIPGNLKSNLHELFFVMYSTDPHPVAPVINEESTLPPEWHGFQFQPLADQWWSYVCRPNMATASSTLTITARSPLFIAAALGRTKDGLTPISDRFSKSMRQEVMPPLKGRWARADAAILVPAAAPGYMFLLVFTPALSPDGVSPSLTLFNDTSPWHSSTFLHPGAWQWLILPLPPERTRDAWMRFQVQPAWNPHKAGFPPDLGVFFGKVIVAPAPREEMQNVE